MVAHRGKILLAMNNAELDELMRHAAEHREAILYTPAKLVPLQGEHRRPVFELVTAPAEGESIPVTHDLEPERARS